MARDLSVEAALSTLVQRHGLREVVRALWAYASYREASALGGKDKSRSKAWGRARSLVQRASVMLEGVDPGVDLK